MAVQKTDPKAFDFEQRTFIFAKAVRCFTKTLPRTVANFEDVKQLVRSSGSVGANYIEAREGLSKKDFLKYLRIARKEAKETRYWLRLLDTGDSRTVEMERANLARESGELLNILSAMIRTATS